MNHRLRARLLALAAAGLAVLTLAAPGSLAHAADPVDSPIQIVLDTLSPVVPTPDGNLTIKGRLINRSPGPITSLRVQLRRSVAPLTNSPQIATVLTDP